MFDSRRRMKATMAKEVDEKLVVQQRKKLDFNRALLFMYSNQVGLTSLKLTFAPLQCTSQADLSTQSPFTRVFIVSMCVLSGSRASSC